MISVQFVEKMEKWRVRSAVLYIQGMKRMCSRPTYETEHEYLSTYHTCGAKKAQVNLRKCADSPEPSSSHTQSNDLDEDLVLAGFVSMGG